MDTHHCSSSIKKPIKNVKFITEISDECLHIYIRTLNIDNLIKLCEYISSENNHELFIKVHSSIYNINNKNEFIKLYLHTLIRELLNNGSESNSDKINKCKEIIALCSSYSLKHIAKDIIASISLEEFKKLISYLNIKSFELVDVTIYGNLDIILFIKSINKDYVYDESIVINYIIETLNNNSIINFDKLKWIIDNYKECLNKNLLQIISGIKNFTENNNSYIVIDYIFYLIKITYQDIYKIFKKIIYNGNEILFCYISIKYLSKIPKFNYFEYACLFSNPNSNLNNNLINLAYDKTVLDEQKLDDIFNKACKYKIKSAILWFTTFLPERYSINQNEYKINITGTITPSLSKFYFDKRCKFVFEKNESECCVCFENKQHMIGLNCHISHIICSECMETVFNIKQSCPLCRSNINITDCSIYL